MVQWEAPMCQRDNIPMKMICAGGFPDEGLSLYFQCDKCGNFESDSSARRYIKEEVPQEKLT